MTGTRRVVTGLDAEGRSCIVIDGPVPQKQLVWHTPAMPADNAGTADASIPFTMDLLKDGSSCFAIVQIPAGMPRFMHSTDTIDYLVILDGQLVLEMETGETILGPGDCVVQRGTMHAWRNDGPQPVTMVSITLPAHPVGKGATV